MPKKVSDQIKETIKTYNKIAEMYDKYTENKLMQWQLTEFTSMLPKGGKVLDAGCGPGRDTIYLMGDGLDVLGIDLSPKMVKLAKEKGANAKKMDLLTLKLPKESFDGIWCMAALHSVAKKEASQVLKNFHQIMKDQAVIYIAVKEGEGEKVIETEKYCMLPRFFAFYKKEEFEEMLKESGFIILRSMVSNDSGVRWVEVFAKKA